MRMDTLEPIGSIIPRVLDDIFTSNGQLWKEVKPLPAAAVKRGQLRHPSRPHGPPPAGKVSTRLGP